MHSRRCDPVRPRPSDRPLWSVFAMLAVLLAPGCGGSGSTTVEPRVPGPASAAHASRFLARATFGATGADIAALQDSNYIAWVLEQQRIEPSLLLPRLRARHGERFFHEDRTALWWQHAAFAPDQLRQRVAFALSQVFVVSQRNDTLQAHPDVLADYYDTLVRGAFGSYRALLEDVTLHPAMGVYLSMARNRAPEPGSTDRPDENFAREVMQLFSIGLQELHPDGTPRLDAEGRPIPTYDQAVINGTALALTGWNFRGAPDDGELRTWLSHSPRLGRMEPTEHYHDHGPKQLVGGATTRPGQSASDDLATVLDTLAAHPNVGPFLGRQLIQRLVTSNPSPYYVARVATVFADDGTGQRGNLGAVVAAILIDPEADLGYDLFPDRFGKLREPLLKSVAVLRAFGIPGADFVVAPGSTFGQNPLQAPSVFNFFRPDHSTRELAQGGMVAPELQIITQANLPRTANDFGYRLVWPDGPGFPLDLGTELALADDLEALVDHLDLVLVGGTLSETSRRAILDHLRVVPFDIDPDLPPPDLAFERVREALHLIALSPDFAVQR